MRGARPGHVAGRSVESRRGRERGGSAAWVSNCVLRGHHLQRAVEQRPGGREAAEPLCVCPGDVGLGRGLSGAEALSLELCGRRQGAGLWPRG